MANRNPPDRSADRDGRRNMDPARRYEPDDNAADFLGGGQEPHSHNYWPSHYDEDNDHWPLQSDDRDGWHRTYERPRAYIAYDRPHPFGTDRDSRELAPQARERTPYQFQRQSEPYRPSRDFSGARSALDGRFERQWDPRFGPFSGEHGPTHSARSHGRGRGPKGYTRSDERIREDVHDRLSQLWETDISDVEIAVTGGEVTLSGSVRDRSTKFRVENIADAISGVTEVHNSLRVRPEGASTERDAEATPKSSSTGRQ